MTPLALRTPADLLGAIPFLLGFHPSDSVVVVGLRARHVVFAARGDLGEPPGFVEYVTSVVMRQDVDCAAVVGYGSDERAREPVTAIRAALERHGVGVLDTLRVAGGRYWSYACPGDGCCPPEGTAFDPVASPVAAAATHAGHVALPDRDALVRQIEPVGGLTRESMRQATERAATRLARHLASSRPGDLLGSRAVRRLGVAAVREAMRRHREGGHLTDDEVAWLTVLLVHLPIRDYAWERVGADDWHLELWADVLRRAEPHLVPAPASLLAFAAWRCGQGALALAAVERAKRSDPAYSMARLLDDVLHRGIPPSTLEAFPMPPHARAGGGRPRRRAKA
ncbi:DUF4192 domain-containing protein [Phytohabitans sp. ZYX-F-186]|uniref:DUF4192 domain-containing protein n=2 Tax=Phytohabitans maris TaxID=3071409 RepID=A0ABU0ZJ59_9ACTN|nr:DUF4192 domain-containing protein [Phytohabitans sp. ZYX-F-186]MDQ7907084.1 DUF4192 domain-containing protein [Phytohabitans sp. ZYX-F-186]